MDISRWCCVFENDNGIQGSGVITKFTGVEIPDELSKVLPGLKKADGKIETLWAIFTCHRVMPGDCLTGWKIHCRINGDKMIHEMDKVVSGVVSCCASQSVIGPGSSSVAKDPHLGIPCNIDLDFTILFCRHQFVYFYEDYSPPSIPVPGDLTTPCMIHTVKEASEKSSSMSLYVLDHGKVELELIPPQLKDYSGRTRIRDEIKVYESLRRLHYKCESTCSSELLVGSPVIFSNSKLKHELIGINIGENPKLLGQKLDHSNTQPAFVGNTIFGIIQLLKGGPVPVLGVLQNYEARRLSTHRWHYLLMPYLGFQHRFPLIWLIDLFTILSEKTDIKDNLLSLRPSETKDARLATLELLNALFVHFERYDARAIENAVNGQGEKFKSELHGNFKHVFWGIETILVGIQEIDPDICDIEVVEKYLKCYSTVLNFKHVFVEQHMVADDYKALRILINVAENFKSSMSVQDSWKEIVKKCWILSECLSINNSCDQQSQLQFTAQTVEGMSTFLMMKSEERRKLSNDRDALIRSNQFLKTKLSSESGKAEQLRHENQQLLEQLRKLQRQLNIQDIDSFPLEDEIIKSPPIISGVLPGVDVCGDTRVVVTNTGQTISWEGYGLRLDIPDGCLPPNIEECTIYLIASLAGQYEFPDDSHLVTTVYWLQWYPQCKFVKPITVEIQHCAVEENLSKIRVVQSNDITQKNSSLARKFNKLEGVFVEKKQNCISCDVVLNEGLLGLAAVQVGSEDRNYRANLFHLDKIKGCPEIHFVVFWNLDSHHTFVKGAHSEENETTTHCFDVIFESKSITFDIPAKGIAAEKGWQIIPLTAQPAVVKEHLDSLKPRYQPSSIQLLAISPGDHSECEVPMLEFIQHRIRGGKVILSEMKHSCREDLGPLLAKRIKLSDQDSR